MNLCNTCNKETANPKFCNRSCSAKYTNKHYPKRIWKCKRCKEEKERPSKRAIYCKNCTNRKSVWLNADNISWNDLIKKYGIKRSRIIICDHARYIFRESRKDKCKCCSYSKHTEICHIKDVKDFDKDSLLSEINSLSNLIELCPNCHWEFDHLGLDISHLI